MTSKHCFYSDFSLFMQLYRVKYIKYLRTSKYSLSHKCKWNLSLVWLFLAIVTCNLSCLDRVVLAHPFWALTTFPVCFSVLNCWTNRAPSMLSSSTIRHCWLFASDTHCSHGPARMSVDVSTISPSSRENGCRHLGLLFFYCQLGYFCFHSTNAFTQATSVKLRNSFKGQHLVDLVQVYWLTGLSRMSSPLLV